ncbi:pyridoxal phosphate-dependent aminotransferase [bacterium]|nr:pyridoxal phosphate-dependent aminotransferase [bacterium]
MPEVSTHVRSLKQSVYASLAEKMKALPEPPIGLHLGDTYAVPPAAARWEGLDLSAPGNYRYSHPSGLPVLLEELSVKLARENGLAATPDWVQVTCGATHALHSAVHTLLQPGDGIIILSPYWPLFGGMVRCLGAVDHEMRLADLEMRPRVRALYFANPNNPDGKVYSREELQRLAAFAQEHDLWVISDECYEHYLYDGHQHISIASLPGMAERTVSVFSFSKSYAMAGHRVGYLCAHPEVMLWLRRLANHSVYNISPSLQKAALAVLRQGRQFVSEWLPAYAAARDRMAEAVKAKKPEGGAYFFPAFRDAQQAWDFVEQGLQAGVAVAPGAAFGDDFAHHVRICFTSVDGKTLERACQILQRLFQSL